MIDSIEDLEVRLETLVRFMGEDEITATTVGRDLAYELSLRIRIAGLAEQQEHSKLLVLLCSRMATIAIGMTEIAELLGEWRENA